MTTAVHERVRASARTHVREGLHHLEFEAMATRCRVVFPASAPAAGTLDKIVLDWVAGFEARYSRFLPDSLISRINAQAGKGWVETNPELDRLLGLCNEAVFFTRGVFDPTALPLIKLWNWKTNPPMIPDDDAIAAARRMVGWTKVQRAPGKIFLPEAGMSLDLGGIGKEYAVDQVAALASQHGIRDVLVDFGQDVLALGTPPGRPAWHVGLEDPKQPGKCWAGVAAKNVAVATSGDYLRRFEVDGKRYGHILDVRSGRPVANGCCAVSVIAPRCTVAGLLATSCFVLGPEEGLRMLDTIPDVAGCIITETNRVTSRRFYEYVVS